MENRKRAREEDVSKPLAYSVDAKPHAEPSTSSEPPTRRRKKHWAANPSQYAFGVTFTYEESKMREVSWYWPSFFNKFIEDYTKMKFEASVPPIERAERISSSQIFVYWYSSGRNAYRDTVSAVIPTK